MGNVVLSESFNFAAGMPNGPHNEIPAVIRTELNAYSDRDMMVRMRHLARKKRMRQPDITDEEMADYLALAEHFENSTQWISARRGTLKRPLGITVAWVVAISATLGFLTAMLIVRDRDRSLMAVMRIKASPAKARYARTRSRTDQVTRNGRPA